MKTPCELIVWYLLPVVRSELAHILVKEHGLSQKAVAQKMGVTEAAISQYLSKKRGQLEINDPKLIEEINLSAKFIKNGDKNTTLVELCRICNIFKATGGLKPLYEQFSKDGTVPEDFA